MYQEWFKKYETLIDDELTKIKKELFEMYQDQMDEVPLDVEPVEKEGKGQIKIINGINQV